MPNAGGLDAVRHSLCTRDGLFRVKRFCAAGAGVLVIVTSVFGGILGRNLVHGKSFSTGPAPCLLPSGQGAGAHGLRNRLGVATLLDDVPLGHRRSNVSIV